MRFSHLLSLEISSTFRRSKTVHVMTFMGTRNQFITFARCDSGITWLLQYEIAARGEKSLCFRMETTWSKKHVFKTTWLEKHVG